MQMDSNPLEEVDEDIAVCAKMERLLLLTTFFFFFVTLEPRAESYANL